MQREMLFWIWLSEALGAANRNFKTLIECYDHPYDLFHAEEEELERIEGLLPRTWRGICNKDLGRATEILDDCERLGIEILTYQDERFPVALRELPDPPVLLYYSGELPDFNRSLAIGMVGTRRMSAYGLQSAYKIAYELATAGVLVVSGMAAGIDGVSAAGAIAGGGATVAILGSGLDVVYPKHHAVLKNEILKKGVLLSEYPPGTRPNHYHFPIRNRLISGITRGTVVVEAGLGSGSLITAKDAIAQGRDVFAIPANVGSHGAEGTNGLLRDGARLALCGADILEPYQYVYAERLNCEALAKVDANLRADLAYLDRMGVIELTKRSAASPSVRAAEPVEESKKKSAKSAERSSGSQKKTCEKQDEPKSVKTAKETKVQESAVKEPRKTPDEVLSSLSPLQLAILQTIPEDRAVSADALSGLGYPYGDIIAALTMLEILGVIQKLPGALYTKT